MAGYRGRLGGFVFNFFLSCMDGSICMHTGLDLLSFFLSFFFGLYYFRVQLDYELRDVESVSGSNSAPI